MRLTIISPVFNAENYIEETVRSILPVLKNKNVEYLIVNDGSTDSTVSVLNKIKGTFTIIEKENGGEASAVNFGLSNATGEYILVVNADDPILDIERLVFEGCKILDNESNIVAVYPNWRLIDEFGKTIKSIETLEFSLYSLFNKAKCLPGPGAMFRADCAKSIGGRKAKWKYVGDFDFWLRMSTFGDFRKIPEELASWRLHTGSLSTSGAGKLMAAENVEVIREFIKNRNFSTSDKNEALANAHLNAALVGLSNHKLLVQKYLVRCIRLCPSSLRGIRKVTLLYLFLLPLSYYMRISCTKVKSLYQLSILRKV